MAIFMIRAAMPETEVLTEDNCYRPYDEVIGGKTEHKELRCDIAIRQENTGVVSWDIVEVKCWRFVANSLEEFIGKIGGDIAKIRGNVLDDTDPYKPYKGSNRLWAIGLILASDVDKDFNAQQAKDKLEQSHSEVDVNVKNSATQVITDETHDLTYVATFKNFVIVHWHEIQQST